MLKEWLRWASRNTTARRIYLLIYLAVFTAGALLYLTIWIDLDPSQPPEALIASTDWLALFLSEIFLIAAVGSTLAYTLTHLYLPNRMRTAWIALRNNLLLYSTLAALLSLFEYLFLWNRFPDIPVFEARFQMWGVIFGVFAYLANKLKAPEMTFAEHFYGNITALWHPLPAPVVEEPPPSATSDIP